LELNPTRHTRKTIHPRSQFSLAIAAGLLVTLGLAAPAAAQISPQQSCPTARDYAMRPPGICEEGESRRVRVQAVYFRTDDKNAFISEANGVRLAPSTRLFRYEDFSGKLAQLVARGKAEINSRRTGTLLLAESAALDRGPQALNRNANYFDKANIFDVQTRWLPVPRVRALDRHTTFAVFRRKDEDFYRVGLVSWFVEIGPNGGGRMTVDLDAGVFLRPGETQIFKFLSDFEVERTGEARTHLALTLVTVEGDDVETRAQATAARAGSGPLR
jgi:hypothetical protein